MVRCFAAVTLPSQVRDELARVRAALAVVPGVKWVDPEHAHLTVRFFGDVPHDRVEELQLLLADAAAATPRGAVLIQGVGTFPGRGVPRVVWLGVTDATAAPTPTGGLWGLAAAVAREAEGRGFPPEDRAFSPHLTLGRVRRDGRPTGLTAALQPFTAHTVGTVAVERLTLFQSELRHDGPRYTVLGEWALG